MRHRIIPVLLLKNNGLYKGRKFKDHKYVGDPINAVKIFNDKEVDELVFLDITASLNRKEPNYEMLFDIASECFMPLAYGGGIDSVEMIRKLLSVGIEKVILNTYAVRNPEFVKEAVKYFGSSTIVVSIDAKKNLFGKYNVYIQSGQEKTNLNPVDWAIELEKMGVGEIIINSIDKDGTLSGYDFLLVEEVAKAVNLPVIAAGGAAGLNDFVKACKVHKASAAAAGAKFVFQGKHNAVLITYPSQVEIEDSFQVKI
jgi:imidazole glycerol-phosphate synthase subunit HisF